MEYPWSAIGRVNVAGRAFCSGFLISENQVMTAAHCLYDFKRKRWVRPDDVHFIAGYQRDQYILHSRTKTYLKAPHFKPPRDESDTDLVVSKHDWAILTLEKPIGKQAGWLATRVADKELLGSIRVGRGVLIMAGYHAGRAHAQSVRYGCRLSSILHKQQILTHSCHAPQGFSGAPLLAIRGEEVMALGIHSIDVMTDHGREAGVFSFLGLLAPRADRDTLNQLAAHDVDLGKGMSPPPDSPASADPINSIRYLRKKGVTTDLGPTKSAELMRMLRMLR